MSLSKASHLPVDLGIGGCQGICYCIIYLDIPWVILPRFLVVAQFGKYWLSHRSQDKMAAIFWTTFSNGFFLNQNVCILIKISLKCVPMGPINNIPALVQIMAWCRPSNKPLSEPKMVCLLTHICVTGPQWVIQGITLVHFLKNIHNRHPQFTCEHHPITMVIEYWFKWFEDWVHSTHLP